MKDAIVDVSQVSKNFNASTLVQRSRFYKPHVLLAVFDWHSLFSCSLTGNLLVPCHQKVHFVIFSDSGDYESRWRSVKDCVTGAHSSLNCQVILLK